MIPIDITTAVVVKRYLKAAHVVCSIPVDFEGDKVSWRYELDMMKWLERNFPIELSMMRVVSGKYTGAFMYKGTVTELGPDDGISVFDFN